jgi:hypothetical protein
VEAREGDRPGGRTGRPGTFRHRLDTHLRIAQVLEIDLGEVITKAEKKIAKD